jgi:hypothetical protein
MKTIMRESRRRATASRYESDSMDKRRSGSLLVHPRRNLQLLANIPRIERYHCGTRRM